MKTDFNLVNWLASWFHRKDASVNTGGRDINTSGGDVIVGAGTVDGVDLTAHVADTDAHHNEAHTLASHSGQLSHDSDLTDVSANDHHNQAHVLATGSALGPDHTISGAADGQVLRANSSTAARFDPLDHDDLDGVTANQHHNEAHTVASHSDTTATGSELNTLTDGSDASSLHDHDGRYFQESEFSSNPGSNSKPLESDSAGNLFLVELEASADIKAGGGLAVGNTLNPQASRVLMTDTSKATPVSGYVYFYAKSGRLYYTNSSGTEYGPLT